MQHPNFPKLSFCIENTRLCCYGSYVEKPRTIVVVDDDQLQAKLLYDYLTENGYEVLVAFTGQDGLQRIYEAHPDLVILDLYLPDIMGTEICAQLRSNMATRQIPIVLCTAHNIGTAKKIEGFRAGVDDFLVRPFDLSELLVRIEAILRRAESKPKTELLIGLGALINKPTGLDPVAPPTVVAVPAPAAVTTPFVFSPKENAGPAHRPIDFLHRVWEVLNHPWRAFDTLDENSDFLISLFLVAGTPLIASFSKLSQKSAAFDTWIGILSLGLVVHFVMWIGTAGLLHLVLPFESANLSMKKALSIAGLAWAPRLLAAIFAFLYGVISLTGWSGDSTEFSSGLDILPGLPSASWVSLLSHVGIFDVWCTGLTLIGAWSVSQTKDRRWTSITLMIATLGLLCGAFLNT